MAAHAARGKKALETSDFETAVQAYSDAIKEFPTSPDYFIQRSTAYQRAQKVNEALRDAEQAVVNAQQRGKKDLIIDAQQRRGISLYHLGRYGDAEFIFNLIKQKSPDNKHAVMWLKKTEINLQNLDAADERRNVSVLETPVIQADAAASTSASQIIALSTSGTTAPQATAPVAQQQTPANKIRHEWYQNTEHIYFTLLARGVPKDKAEIETTSNSLSISFPLVTDSTYEMTLEPLFAPIISEKTITKIMPSKVEIILFKAQPNQKWPSLEGTEATSSTATDPITASTSTAAAPPKPIDKPPAYPTSSRTGPKNWDTITSNLTKKPTSSGATASDDNDPSTTTVLDDDDDDMEGGDATNNFFKKLYKNATPEVRRAMMKSYTESNGTSLSTSWDEVKKGKVETLPPDGMEAKQW